MHERPFLSPGGVYEQDLNARVSLETHRTSLLHTAMASSLSCSGLHETFVLPTTPMNTFQSQVELEARDTSDIMKEVNSVSSSGRLSFHEILSYERAC